MKKMEVLRCKGIPISVTEERFRAKLEALYRELNQPNMFKGKLAELGPAIRLLGERPMSTIPQLDEPSLQSIYSVWS
jgi:hypothetical protein